MTKKETTELVSSPTGDIQAQYDKLKKIATETQQEADYLKGLLRPGAQAELTRILDRKIQGLIDGLEFIDKKDLEKSQGQICGLRQSRSIVMCDELEIAAENAKWAAENFANNNALLLCPDQSPKK